MAVGVDHDRLIGIRDTEFEAGEDFVEVVVCFCLRWDRAVGHALGFDRLEGRRSAQTGWPSLPPRESGLTITTTVGSTVSLGVSLPGWTPRVIDSRT
jgi:hypothetical protein